MKKEYADIVIIGGGPAGMAAAAGAYEAGCRDIVILERDAQPGGALRQCFQRSFGLQLFGQIFSGPEYVGLYEQRMRDLGVTVLCNVNVLSFNRQREITADSAGEGVFRIKAGAIILAMGCRERPCGALTIPGSRPAGVFTAGEAQNLINLHGFLPGRDVVILGSDDLGLIAAKRLTLSGARVKAVCEASPYVNGMAVNVEECLIPYDIPLLLEHPVTRIMGKDRLIGIRVAKMDAEQGLLPGSEQEISCDTLVVSAGLIPENELSRDAGVEMTPGSGGPIVDQRQETSIPGVFACGNVLHIHDLVDEISYAAQAAGRHAARFVQQGNVPVQDIAISAEDGVRYLVPQRLSEKVRVMFRFRVCRRFRNGQAQLWDGETPVAAGDIHAMNPGELEMLELTAEAAEALSGGPLRLTVEER